MEVRMELVNQWVAGHGNAVAERDDDGEWYVAINQPDYPTPAEFKLRCLQWLTSYEFGMPEQAHLIDQRITVTQGPSIGVLSEEALLYLAKAHTLMLAPGDDEVAPATSLPASTVRDEEIEDAELAELVELVGPAKPGAA
jgi:hypothetical protein